MFWILYNIIFHFAFKSLLHLEFTLIYIMKAKHLHFMLNGKTRRAPGPLPDTRVQTAWEDTDHKVS
jgi:hypothetical protein